MEFVLVEKAKSPAYFKRVEKIYLDSFPISQLRPTRMITQMVNISKQTVMNSIGLIFEVERERPMENNKDGFRHRRVLFYRRLGAKAFDNVHYMLPDLHGGKPQ